MSYKIYLFCPPQLSHQKVADFLSVNPLFKKRSRQDAISFAPRPATLACRKICKRFLCHLHGFPNYNRQVLTSKPYQNAPTWEQTLPVHGLQISKDLTPRKYRPACIFFHDISSTLSSSLMKFQFSYGFHNYSDICTNFTIQSITGMASVHFWTAK